MTVPVSPGESGHGSANAGGIGSRMFAKDGGILYLGQHPTWAFPLSVQKARPLQTC